jgi:hypothetical protein
LCTPIDLLKNKKSAAPNLFSLLLLLLAGSNDTQREVHRIDVCKRGALHSIYTPYQLHRLNIPFIISLSSFSHTILLLNTHKMFPMHSIYIRRYLSLFVPLVYVCVYCKYMYSTSSTCALSHGSMPNCPGKHTLLLCLSLYKCDFYIGLSLYY